VLIVPERLIIKLRVRGAVVVVDVAAGRDLSDVFAGGVLVDQRS
jgi:hypothetical protein